MKKKISSWFWASLLLPVPILLLLSSLTQINADEVDCGGGPLHTEARTEAIGYYGGGPHLKHSVVPDVCEQGLPEADPTPSQ